jgi:hypothetical protein
VLVHHAVDADWSVWSCGGSWKNIAWLFPVLAVLFVPIVFSATTLFKWMKYRGGLSIRSSTARRPTSTNRFFWARSAFYFLFFSTAAWFLRRNSVRQD